MGLLVEGKWQDKWYDTKSTGGRFERSTTTFRDWVTPDGSPGPDGQHGFKAEQGRYHLYVSLACPWAHRTLITRKLKKLEDVISLSVVDYHMGEEGWVFSERPGAIPDTVNGKQRLYEVYLEADPHLHRPGDRAGALGQADRDHRQQRVRRTDPRSSTAASTHGAIRTVDVSPEELRGEIDAINDPRLPPRQQRRVQGRLRDHAGRLRRSRSAPSFEQLDGWRSGCRSSATSSPPPRRPRPTGGCSRR